MKAFNGSLLVVFLLFGMAADPFSPRAAAAERCEPWIGKVVSVQGDVLFKQKGENRWKPLNRGDILCPEDMIRVEERARAAVLLPNEAILRLDQGTMVTFMGLEKEKTSLLDLIKGALYFFSRKPRALKIATPFVNGTVEGTECFVRVEEDRTLLTVFSGTVMAENKAGSLSVVSGQSAVAEAEKMPRPYTVVRPRDAVTWALYFPPVIPYRPDDVSVKDEAGWQAMLRRSIEFYRKGDLPNAFKSLDEVPERISDPRYFVYRAGLLLIVGRVQEAGVDIERALNLAPRNSDAFALQAMIAVVQNQKATAMDVARRAVDLDPGSATARIALSYAQQAYLEIEPALESLREAVRLDPEDALAWSRLAELWLSVGQLDRALEAAEKGASLNPDVARTQSVQGFACLMQIKIKDAKMAFEKAIQLDEAAPLPRLGLGLAKIREGDLKEGRREIEIAAVLDPNNALIRSYLGKAYFEERRDGLAMKEYAVAKDLDPLDPTAYFYDAIRKQSVNRPVEALKDLRRSIALNRNRTVYRSSLLLDEDLAARSAGLARIYRDLGFEQLALVEGWKSVNRDPGNYSAHRFLADTYSSLPRHEIARVNELLQSQLLQPLNVTPVQPQQAESNLFILEGSGPADPGFNEFNPLFLRNRFAFLANGMVGGNDTFGEEMVQSGVQGRLSYSVGQMHYETEGFRENNDLTQNIYNVFVQGRLSHKTSVQTEFRYTSTRKGDLVLKHTGIFSPTQRQEEQAQTVRFGLHHAFGPGSDLILSFISQNGELHTEIPDFLTLATDRRNYIGEVSYIHKSHPFQFNFGLGHRHMDDLTVETVSILPFFIFQETEDSRVAFSNAYFYSQVKPLENLSLTIGASADFLEGSTDVEDCSQFNPKIGVMWSPDPDTTLRAAAFRTLQRPFFSQQNIDPSLEPTQVAGFNQFFFSARGDHAWRYGVGADRKFSETVYAGAEIAYQDGVRRFVSVRQPGDVIVERDWEEYFGRAYFCWTPKPWTAISAEYLFERFERDVAGRFAGVAEFEELETHRFPLGVKFFHPRGFSAGIKATYVSQEGRFVVASSGSNYSIVPGEDKFWVVDASIGYRLPKRLGLITLEAKNLFDQEFKFQDTDPGNPRIVPDRLILMRATFSF